MSVCASSVCGQKLRLNVVALVGEGFVGKLLVAIDEDALVEHLATKIRASLANSRIAGKLLRLTNSLKAHLPPEERVGDVLRDGEEVIAVLTQEADDPITRQQMASGMGDAISFMQSSPRAVSVFPGASKAPLRLQPTEVVPVTAPQACPVFVTTDVPGPMEVFEDDIRDAPAADLKPAVKDYFPSYPSATKLLAGDWEVEQLTQKLREYIVARFREIHDTPADPGRAYLTVSLRPRESPGAVVTPLPVHYSIARVDIIEFERLCGRKVEETRGRLDFFRRCREALHSLLDRGASRQDDAPNMLPYRYRDGEEFGSLINEVDENIFGQVEGFRPIIVIDTSGALGESLVFVKAALKRMLYSFLVTKSRFNIVACNSQGRAVAWEDRLVPPVAQKLREAEDFLESLCPARAGSDILEAVRYALEPSDADAIYLLSSGFAKRTDVGYVLADLRSRNLRQLPIHVIGVGCEARAELDLRRLAEENCGSFRQKHFKMKASLSVSVQDLLSAGRTASQSSRKAGDGRLSIGGQVDILEVMIREQEVQVTDWLEEQKCANRILLSSATQQPVPDLEQARYAAGRTVTNYLCRAPPPFLKDMLEYGRRPTQSQRPVSARQEPVRRVSAHPGQRTQSQPRQGMPRILPRGGKVGQASEEEMRKPSIANPWDRPSGIVKVSQLLGNGAGKGPPKPRVSRPSSAHAGYAR